jgi:hypothetical protein
MWAWMTQQEDIRGTNRKCGLQVLLPRSVRARTTWCLLCAARCLHVTWFEMFRLTGFNVACRRAALSLSALTNARVLKLPLLFPYVEAWMLVRMDRAARWQWGQSALQAPSLRKTAWCQMAGENVWKLYPDIGIACFKGSVNLLHLD